MQGISTFLWFEDRAFEAARFYVSVFPNSRIIGDEVFHDERQGKEKDVPIVSFELDGRPFSAINGGPVFAFTPAISFVISCDDQAEVDRYWERLTDGGEESMCGWLIDRFGVSWQVVPVELPELIAGPDADGAARATSAMLQMRKLDLEMLRAAYAGG
jgi:predicted 3-demethylubiquinone-9 3-methyltransferase (glyoxalase superfamily)